MLLGNLKEANKWLLRGAPGVSSKSSGFSTGVFTVVGLPTMRMKMFGGDLLSDHLFFFEGRGRIYTTMTVQLVHEDTIIKCGRGLTGYDYKRWWQQVMRNHRHVVKEQRFVSSDVVGDDDISAAENAAEGKSEPIHAVVSLARVEVHL